MNHKQKDYKQMEKIFHYIKKIIIMEIIQMNEII